MIPTKDPSDLSESARALYCKAVDDYRQTKIDNGDKAKMAAATEIAEAGLGTLHITKAYGSTLNVNRLLTAFSVARRDDARDHDGYLYMEVEVLDSPNASDGPLLAALFGATLTNKSGQGSPWPRWTAEVRHASATDSDHSGCILATLDLDNLVLNDSDGFETSFKGILSGIKMYETGTDVTLLGMHDGDPIDEPAMCTCGRGGDTPHPYGPYLPPSRKDLSVYKGRAVKVTVTPIANVADNGLHTSRNAVTHADY